MKSLFNTICGLMLATMMIALQSCDKDNKSDLSLDGDTRIESIKINGFSGVIDHTAKVVSVNVSTDIDLTNLCIEEITLSKGATLSLIHI